MARTTIKITTGIDLKFDMLSDFEVAANRIYFSKLQRNTFIASIVFLAIGFLMVILNLELYNEEFMWLSIVGSIAALFGFIGLWWSKIYNDTRKKCDKEMRRRVQSKYAPTQPHQQAAPQILYEAYFREEAKAQKTQPSRKPSFCQGCGAKLINLNEYMEETTPLKMKAIYDSGIFGDQAQIPAKEFAETINTMKPTKQMEEAMKQTNLFAKKVGLTCKSCNIIICANCGGMADEGNLSIRMSLCQNCGNQLEFH